MSIYLASHIFYFLLIRYYNVHIQHVVCSVTHRVQAVKGL
jgi:hypothetical protein